MCNQSFVNALEVDSPRAVDNGGSTVNTDIEDRSELRRSSTDPEMYARESGTSCAVPMTVSFRQSQLAAGILHSQDGNKKAVTRENVPTRSPTPDGGRGQVRCIWETRRKASHCSLHARDYSDCMPFHFIRPLQLEPHVAMMDAVKKVVEGNASTPVEMPVATEIEATQLPTDARSKACSSPQDCACTTSKSKIDRLQTPVRQVDVDGSSKKPAHERSEGRKREVFELDTAGEMPLKAIRSAIYGNSRPGVAQSEGIPASCGREVFANFEIKSLIAWRESKGRVGGCAEIGESSRHPMNTEEEARSAIGTDLKRVVDDCWGIRQLFVVMKDSGDCKGEFGLPMIVCGRQYRKKSSRGFAGKGRVRALGMRENPLEVLGSDLMLAIFSRLDARSLARCGVISKDWKALAHMDSLWFSKCVKLWEGKTHLPFSALQDGLPKVVSYSRSMQDAKRTKITSEDLCEHDWEFRFKSRCELKLHTISPSCKAAADVADAGAAPGYWLDLDPTQRGEAPMKRFFHMDGSQTAGPDDKVWGGHECFYSLVSEVSPDQTKLECFVQINHWPYMSASRTEDWGWVLNSRVHDYRSMPDPWKQGGTGPAWPAL